MKTLTPLFLASLLTTLAGCGSDSETNSAVNSQIRSKDLKQHVDNAWFSQGSASIEQAKQHMSQINGEKGAAKNIILFVGDGMGISTVTAARILEGQLNGQNGEEHNLSFDLFPFSGLSKTYNVDAQTPDSAGTMTAMITGVKTDVGVLSIDEDVIKGDCSTVAGNELVSALELAEMAGLSTGVVSTARITHATPAATYAKSPHRDWEDDTKAQGGCEDIASQLIHFERNLENRYDGLNVNGIEVVMGGGRRHFLPNDVEVEGAFGKRQDGRHLINEWQEQYPSGQYVMNQTGFDSVNPETTDKLFALFNASHMQYEADRGNDISGEPTLAQMTEKAIHILNNNDKGFFLTVEAGRIDHGHHAGNAYNALHDTLALSDAVQKALTLTNSEETLIIVTADHSHVFTIAGYPKRGNPILGKVVAPGASEPTLADDGLPYTTLGYTNGRGFKNLGQETNADAGYGHDIVSVRTDLSTVDTTTPGFHQEAHVPRSSETHAGEDVAIYASGPGAHLISGTNEQNVIFHVMNHAGNLVGKADAALKDAAP